MSFIDNCILFQINLTTEFVGFVPIIHLNLIFQHKSTKLYYYLNKDFSYHDFSILNFNYLLESFRKNFLFKLTLSENTNIVLFYE